MVSDGEFYIGNGSGIFPKLSPEFGCIQFNIEKYISLITD